MGDTLEDRVQAQAQAAIAPLGLVIDDLSITRAGKRRLVRIAVDDELSGLQPDDHTSTVPPVALDTVADATRAIDAALDADDAMGQAPYVLEVTSPGTSRPLSQPRHFRRNVGRLIKATTTDGTHLLGRITAADANGIRLDLQPAAPTKGAKASAGNEPAQRDVDYAALSSAQVQVEFNRDENDLDDDLTDDLDDLGDDTRSEEQED